MRPRPTNLGVRGAMFAAAIALAFFATAYSNLFFLLLAFLGVLAGLGTLWSRANLRAVAGEVIAIGPAPAGVLHPVQLRLSTGPRVRFQISLQLCIGGRWQPVAEVPLVAGERVLTVTALPLPRGVHLVQKGCLASRYPLGILEWRRPIAVVDEIVAYPVPAELAPGLDRNSAVADLLGQQTVAGGHDVLAGLRPFRAGDQLRDVHWRATARRGTPIVREFDRDAGDGREVVFDRRAAPAAFERALSVLARLLLIAGEDKQRLHLRSQGHDAVYGEGHHPVADGLRWLAAVEPLPVDGPRPPSCSPTAIRLPGAAGTEVARG